jgi:hypothetical protein
VLDVLQVNHVLDVLQVIVEAVDHVALLLEFVLKRDEAPIALRDLVLKLRLGLGAQCRPF